MAVESPGAFNQEGSYGAEITRRAIFAGYQRGGSIGTVTGGLVVAGDCLVTAGSGMHVLVAPGELIVPSSTAGASGYYARVTSSTELTIAASDPTNPRIDRISAIIKDKAYSGTENNFSLAVETGTPTPGATLVNESGIAAAPSNSITLAIVLVPAASASVTGGNILNKAAVAVRSANLLSAKSIIATEQTRTNTAYGTLTTPDEVTVVLPENGLIAVIFDAAWKHGTTELGRAALFLNGVQQKVQGQLVAAVNSGTQFNTLVSAPHGLQSRGDSIGSEAGAATTGEAVGAFSRTNAAWLSEYEGSVFTTTPAEAVPNVQMGGPCYIFAAAGTYTVSVQFKSASGTVTVKKRKLWAWAVT